VILLLYEVKSALEELINSLDTLVRSLTLFNKNSHLDPGETYVLVLEKIIGILKEERTLK